jgi:amino acid transporter
MDIVRSRTVYPGDVVFRIRIFRGGMRCRTPGGWGAGSGRGEQLGVAMSDVAASRTSQSTSESTSQLRRRLTLPDVIAQSVTVIAPGMSGAFLTYLAATKAGGATPLAFVLAMLGALAVGSVVSAFGQIMPSAGSLYTYTATGLSKTAGFVLGWMYSIALIILAAGVLAGFGFFTSLLIQSLTSSDTFVPWYWFFAAGLIFVGLMSLYDVKVSTRSQLLFTVVSVAAMVVAAIWVIGTGSPEGSAQAGKSIDLGAFWPSAAGVSWGGIIFGFAFGMLSFTGFEAGAVLAEETENPKHNIPRAVVGSVLVGGVFYILVTYATSIGFGVREAAELWPLSAAGLAAVTTTATLTNLVLFSAAVASLFCALGVHTAASRFLFAMGRERVLPPALGRTHARWKTPWLAISVSIVLYAVLVWGLLLVSSSATEIALGGGATEGVANLPTSVRGGIYTFAYWATLATPAVMLAYFLLGLAGIRYGQRTNNTGLMVKGVLAAITGAVAVFGSLYYSFVEAAPGAGILTIVAAIPWINLALLVGGIAIAVYLRTNRQDAWADMGTVFDDA